MTPTEELVDETVAVGIGIKPVSASELKTGAKCH